MGHQRINTPPQWNHWPVAAFQRTRQDGVPVQAEKRHGLNFRTSVLEANIWPTLCSPFLNLRAILLAWSMNFSVRVIKITHAVWNRKEQRPQPPWQPIHKKAAYSKQLFCRNNLPWAEISQVGDIRRKHVRGSLEKSLWLAFGFHFTCGNSSCSY